MREQLGTDETLSLINPFVVGVPDGRVSCVACVPVERVVGDRLGLPNARASTRQRCETSGERVFHAVPFPRSCV